MSKAATTRRRALILLSIGGLVTVGVAILALRYTVFFDAQKYWYRLVADGPRGEERNAALAARHHRGSPPCLRYHGDDAPEAELRAIAAKFVAAGLVEQVNKALVLTLMWEEEEESAVHRGSMSAEVLDLFAERAGPIDRLVISLHRDKLMSVSNLDVPSATIASTRRSAEAALTSEQIEKLRALWGEHRALLATAHRFTDHVRRRATELRLDALEAALRAWQEREGAPPSKLEDLGLPSESSGKALEDGWGKAFVYEVTPTGARIVSLGPNMRPAGGDDIERAIRPPVVDPPASEAAPPAGPPPFDCASGPPARVELRRVDLDAHLKEELSRLRLVPELVDGAPVGIRAFGVRADGFASRAGLCNGDRITAIGGRPPTANERELRDMLSKGREIEIALNRRGKDHTYRLVLR